MPISPGLSKSNKPEPMAWPPPSAERIWNSRVSRISPASKVRGQTRFPDPNDPKSVLNADWQKRCTVRFYDLANNQTEIQHADLEGNVVVDHPRFRLSARKDVQLNFDNPGKTDSGQSSSPPLREITADGDADCIVHEANNQDRRISGQTLEIDS